MSEQAPVDGVEGEPCITVDAKLYLPREVHFHWIKDDQGADVLQNGIMWTRMLTREYLESHGVRIIEDAHP